MAVTNNITLFSDTATEYFNATELAEPTNTTHTGAVLNNRLNYKSYNSFAKTVSTICAGLAEFLATYGGIASGTMDVDTDLMTWTNYMQALTTDNKMANAQNAVTPLAISGTTTNTKSTTGHTHSLATGTIASGNQNPITGNTAYTYVNPYFTNTSNIKNSSGGFACGANSKATNGFAGGKNAVANANNAVQLGTGTNTTANTMQFLDKQVLATNFSKLTPSRANGWTQANQDTVLNVDDGLYLMYIVSSTNLISSTEIVSIYSNNFYKSYICYSSETGNYPTTFYCQNGKTTLVYTRLYTSTCQTFYLTNYTYYYKKLV